MIIHKEKMYEANGIHDITLFAALENRYWLKFCTVFRVFVNTDRKRV